MYRRSSGIRLHCRVGENVDRIIFFFKRLRGPTGEKRRAASQAGAYVAAVISWGPPIRLPSCQQSLVTGEQVAPLLLPEALVYRHDVALCGEDVLVIGLVKRVVLVKQLQSKIEISVYLTGRRGGKV